MSVLVVDRGGIIIDVNRTPPPFRRDDVLGENISLFLCDDEVSGMRTRLERVFSSGSADMAEMRTADGRWFDVQAVPVLEAGRVREVLLLCEDATEKKAQKDELARRERRFRALVEKSADAFALLSEDARFVYASPSTARLFGEGVAAVDPFTLVHPSDLERARSALERVKTTTEPVHIRLRVCTTDSVRVVDAVLANMLEDPDVRGIVVNFRDVTELECTREERDRFFELSADLLCVVSLNGFFERLNPSAWEKLLGWTSEELLARPFLDLVHPDDLAATAAQTDAAAKESVASFENRYLCRDGSYRWIQWKSVFDATSGLIYAIARDVTEKRRIDERLMHAQKMEAIGRLAGGVAHDINNMLAVIYSSTELLLSSMPETDEARSEIVDIQHVVQRSAALVRQLLAFGRKRPRSVRDVVIDDAIGPLAKMIARCAGSTFEVIATPNAHTSVRIDPSELESILMNLALNARDAMPDGGTIEISTDVRQLGGARATELGVEAGRYVALRVRDTGCGIPPELRHKVFEPFFTTKELGKGTGLGLATVFGIVQQCGGAVEVESSVGRGSTFIVLLPCARRGTRSRPKLPRCSGVAR